MSDWSSDVCSSDLTALTPALAAAPIGTPPAYAGEHVVPALPNADAFEVTAWVPDLDRGDVPQGLAVLGEHVLVAAYREREGNQDCRIHRFAAATGAHAGSVDLPAPCSHAGGLAVAGGRSEERGVGKEWVSTC